MAIAKSLGKGKRIRKRVNYAETLNQGDPSKVSLIASPDMRLTPAKLHMFRFNLTRNFLKVKEKTDNPIVTLKLDTSPITNPMKVVSV